MLVFWGVAPETYGWKGRSFPFGFRQYFVIKGAMYASFGYRVKGNAICSVSLNLVSWRLIDSLDLKKKQPFKMTWVSKKGGASYSASRSKWQSPAFPWGMTLKHEWQKNLMESIKIGDIKKTAKIQEQWAWDVFFWFWSSSASFATRTYLFTRKPWLVEPLVWTCCLHLSAASEHIQ